MNVDELLPCRDGGAIVGFATFFEKARRVERVGTVKPIALATLPAPSLPMSASPSGGLLVCRVKKFGFGNNARVDLYTLSLSATAAVPVVSFVPYPGGGPNDRPEDVRFTAAPSETRVITCDLKGRLTAWDITGKAVRGAWRTDVGDRMHFGGDNTNDVVLSPGGKWLAAASPGVVTFVDPATGRVLGMVGTSSVSAIPAYDLSCSPTGRVLMARGDHDQLIVIDVATGKVTGAVPLPHDAQGHPAFGPLTCVDDGFALIGGRTLVDATTGAAVTAYRPRTNDGWRSLTATGAGATLTASDNRLLAVHIPDSAVRAAAASGADLVLKPGMSVSLDVQLDGLTDAERAGVESALRKKLVADRFVIAPSADTIVIVRTEPGQPHEHYYGKSQAGMPMFLPPGSGTSMILTDKVTRITIQQGGHTIWEQKRISGPAMSFPLKDGQSLEDGAKATIQYDPKFLMDVVIPAYVAKPASEAAPLGGSQRRGRFDH